MKKVMLGLMLGIFMVSLAGMGVAIPNPAPIYCENMGYTYNDTDCIFNDNSTCELWDFYNGDCGQEYVINLLCKELGEGLSPGYECCEGLVGRNPVGQYNEDTEVCDIITGSFGICISCGDGECDENYEDVCNCEEDCLEAACDSDNLDLCTGNSECTDAGGYWYGGACNEEEEEDEDESDNGQQNQGLGQIIRNKVKAGVYTSETGEQIRVSELAHERIQLRVRNISADCDCELEEETEGNKTKLKIKLSNGRDVEVKIMPDRASERALERLRLKVCSEENNCSIELKEVGKGNQTRAAYEVQIERHARILGIFRAKLRNRVQVDAENGEIIRVKKPWWAFLALEPEE